MRRSLWHQAFAKKKQPRRVLTRRQTTINALWKNPVEYWVEDTQQTDLYTCHRCIAGGVTHGYTRSVRVYGCESQLQTLMDLLAEP